MSRRSNGSPRGAHHLQPSLHVYLGTVEATYTYTLILLVAVVVVVVVVVVVSKTDDKPWIYLCISASL
jgi:1,4-dihydroxy-2-naphthoate octaprenyltransferase